MRLSPPRFPGVRLVVFDLDGTLVDSSRDLASAVNAALVRLEPRAPALSHERVRSFIGDGARTLVARSLAAAGLAVPAERALPVFLERYSRCLLDTTVLYPGVVECLERLRGRRLAVLTNKPGGLSRRILEGLGVSERFFRVVGGDDAPRKPDPAGLLSLAREAAASPGEVLMVGDSANDVRTGRAAGAFTVGVRYGFDPAGLAAEPPDATVEGLEQLAALVGG
ncbi:MAG: HAD-IA family hydrolase [Vicinamibacteria bacterium]